MTQHHKNLLVFSGEEQPVSSGRILSGSTYPHMKFEKDTWRKKKFFEQAKKYFDENNKWFVWSVRRSPSTKMSGHNWPVAAMSTNLVLDCRISRY